MSETHRIDEIERRLIARRAPKPRPTIAEIEAILQRPSDAVSINPDGSVTVGSSADDDIAYLLDELRAAQREIAELKRAARDAEVRRDWGLLAPALDEVGRRRVLHATELLPEGITRDRQK
jgi:hypothetical protein